MSNTNSKVRKKPTATGPVEIENPRLSESATPIVDIQPECADDSDSGVSPGKIIPTEIEPDEGLEDGFSEEYSPGEPIPLGKPEKDDWVALHSDAVKGVSFGFTVRLLRRKQRGEFAPEYFYVSKPLRARVRRQMVQVRPILFYSFLERRVGIWPLAVTRGNAYYESIAQLLAADHAYLSSHEFTIFADQSLRRYRTYVSPIRRAVNWPTESIGQLLARALGEERMILDVTHPVYVESTKGIELELRGLDG